MPLTYYPDELSIQPAKLDDDALLQIGRLIRAFAEIEDIVTLYLFQLAQVSESPGLVMMGRTPLSAKLGSAEYLAKMYGGTVADLHAKVFTPTFYDGLRCRNTVAHGVLLGRSDLGWAFLTADTLAPQVPMAATHKVLSYSTAAIAEQANGWDGNLDEMARALGVRSQREGRCEQPLGPHPKSHQKR